MCKNLTESKDESKRLEGMATSSLLFIPQKMPLGGGCGLGGRVGRPLISKSVGLCLVLRARQCPYERY